jgi:hypothetical protein
VDELWYDIELYRPNLGFTDAVDVLYSYDDKILQLAEGWEGNINVTQQRASTVKYWRFSQYRAQEHFQRGPIDAPCPLPRAMLHGHQPDVIDYLIPALEDKAQLSPKSED